MFIINLQLSDIMFLLSVSTMNMQVNYNTINPLE